MSEPTTTAGRTLLINARSMERGEAVSGAGAFYSMTTAGLWDSILAIEAEAATLVLDVGKVTAALNAAWIDSNDAVGMALPPDLGAHLLARLGPKKTWRDNPNIWRQGVRCVVGWCERDAIGGSRWCAAHGRAGQPIATRPDPRSAS